MFENVLTELYDSRGDYLGKDTTNRQYHYATNKKFTWWFYKQLRKGNRRAISSCALWAIRTMYPELDNNYALCKEGGERLKHRK